MRSEIDLSAAQLRALAQVGRARQRTAEAHVHGDLLFARDVEALVLDPSYAGTDVERAARALPCPLEWHSGFRLGVDELARNASYRGQDHVDLGAAIAERGVLDPRIIGDAARSGLHDEAGAEEGVALRGAVFPGASASVISSRK